MKILLVKKILPYDQRGVKKQYNFIYYALGKASKNKGEKQVKVNEYNEK